MKKTIIILGLLCLLLMPLVSADDIMFTLDQKEYYFLVNQDAIIPLNISNSYGKTISGNMGYTITQEVNQGGFQYSSTKTQNQPFTVQNGNTTVRINFGTSDTPLTLRISMQFSYNDGDDKIVELSDISIYFVSNQSQINNQQNQQQSSSEKVTQGQQSNNQNNQQQHEQTPQQQLQNNQMNQDSSALKEQIQKQLQQEQQTKEQFDQNLFNNSAVQQKLQNLSDQGYEMTNKDLNAINNDSGDFNLSFKNKQGQNASLSGKMENGKIISLQSLTAEDKQQMLDELMQNKQYQQFNQTLENDGFNQTSIEYQQNGNKTDMQINYINEKNETATITAEFYDTQLQTVTLDKKDPINSLFWLIPIIGCFTLLLIIYLYYIRKKQYNNNISIHHEPAVPFDYRQQADLLLKESEVLFMKKQYKDAYSKAGQALRLYLSYHYGLNKETTNDEIISFLRGKKERFDHIRSCFNLCSLVEFAKYKANDHDFNTILNIAKNTIYDSSLQSNDM